MKVLGFKKSVRACQGFWVYDGVEKGLLVPFNSLTHQLTHQLSDS